jgi:UDP-glucuronate decarboxylase
VTLTNPLGPDLASIHERFTLKRRLAGSTVLITGAGGFLGYYLVHYLVDFANELGLRSVVAIDPGAGSPSHWLHEKAAGSSVLTVVPLSVTDVDVASFIGASDPLHLIHAASIASPTFYRQFPKETIDANIWGLRHMLDDCQDLDLRGFLFFSSSEIYGDPTPDAIPTNEEYRGNVSCVGPRACYDESKRFGETIAWVYAQQHGMPITVVRPFNNYGPGMSTADKRLPADLCARVLAGADIELFSSGAPTRTFCYVADAVVGYLQALAYGQYDYFNIGNDTPELSVDEFAESFQRIAAELIGYEGRIIRSINADPEYLTHNPQRRCPDLSKARSLLGYEPSVDIGDGIARYLSHAALALQGART